MENNLNKKVPKEYTNRFGIVAVDMGFVTIEQVMEALSEQVMDNFANKRHRLIGEILFEKGLMTLEQIELVLNKVKDVEKML
jgi:hypothetical protein